MPKRFFRDLVAGFATVRMEANGEHAKLAEWVGDDPAADYYWRRADFWHRVRCRADGTPRPVRIVPEPLPPIDARPPLPMPLRIFFVLWALAAGTIVAATVALVLSRLGA